MIYIIWVHYMAISETLDRVVGEADRVDVLSLVVLVEVLDLLQLALETAVLFVGPGCEDTRQCQRTKNSYSFARPFYALFIKGLFAHGLVVVVEVDRTGNGGKDGEGVQREGILVDLHELSLFWREGGGFGG